MDVHFISSTRIHTFFKSHASPIPIHSKHLPFHQIYLRPASWRIESGGFSLTHQVLDEIPLSDTFAWNNLIHSHLISRDPIGALSIYLHMLLQGARLDKRTFPRVLTASRLCSNLCLGKQVHCQALKLGFSSDQYVITSLIQMYGDLDSTDAAKWLFDKSPTKNSVSWTMLAKFYLSQNKPDLAIDMFHQMMDSNAYQVDPVALATVVGACAKLKSVQQGRNVHEIARKCGLEFDILVANSLLKMYIDCDNIEDARATFDGMPTKDIISWTEIINGYVKNGGFNEALKLFRWMNAVGIKPDSLSICSVLPACARPAAYKHGKEIHAYLLRNGIQLNHKVQNALMDMYIKSGFIECASNVFARMKKRDVISWTVMILGFSLHGQGEVGVELFHRLEDSCIEIDQFTHQAVLRCCTTACMVEEGKLYFNCIKDPNSTHYALMVALLARAALFDEARAFIEEHRIGGHGEVLRAMLDGCQIHQQAEIGDVSHPRAERIYEELQRLMKNIEVETHGPTFLSLKDAEEERECIQIGHSEMLALGFGLISTQAGATVRVTKNHHVCRRCHDSAKLISKIVEREIIIKDSNCFHHFKDGTCSCKDYW
ncbi:pentatricopeptide repeat-containing protein At3g12770 isoform X2 [Hevea brasiliensis]|uniref:pentatricopeptide repeat-containing protein At3g12770 isoform X2 n=1 Tax=Hevea brasiliensis TaxID=3981 RepID=UPI0025FBC779|nr:pentatricopeptide repeat-containing protein At3g12770 isoform X2 [Hevea brasiliensis]